MTIRVLLADDQAVVRAGLRVLVELTDDLVVCGEAADGARAVAMAAALRPDVVLMDLRMPGVDGIDQRGRQGVAHHQGEIRALHCRGGHRPIPTSASQRRADQPARRLGAPPDTGPGLGRRQLPTCRQADRAPLARRDEAREAASR